MKILRVVATNFKQCEDNFTIDFVPRSKKTEEDKEYELIELAPSLYSFNTLSFVGKNASGKTSAVQLLYIVYDLFSNFKILKTKKVIESLDREFKLEVTFFENNNLYKYIKNKKNGPDFTELTNQKIYTRIYNKSERNIFDYTKYNLMNLNDELPEDTSLVFRILNKINLRGLFFSCDDTSNKIYSTDFSIYKLL